MTKSVDIPIQLGPQGKIKTIEGTEHTKLLLQTALADCVSTNPFQRGLGLGEGFIFDNDSVSNRAQLEARVLEIFESFERQRIAKLAPGQEIIIEKTDSGLLEMTVFYIDLRTDRTDQVIITETAGGL